MKIHTKELTVGTTTTDVIAALFEYAQEILGAGWTYTNDTLPKLIFSDDHGTTYGWTMNTSKDVMLISKGVDNKTSYPPSLPLSGETLTGVVWKTTAGSVGIGYRNSSGKYITVFLLTKFDGTYNDEDIYGVSSEQYYASDEIYGKIIVHGNVNIGGCNHVASEGAFVGSGVYLHPLYDPVSGLASSDVFGVRSMPSADYAKAGTIVKQGSASYMAVLSHDSKPNYLNALFVKM